MTPGEHRAAGRIGTAALLEHLTATNPILHAYAARLLRAPPLRHEDPVAVLGEIRDAIGALRLLNARRELAQLAAVLRDDPNDPDAEARRGRLLEISRYVRDVERSGLVRPRPWQQLLARETRR
jgi:hypothetical protein